MDNGALEGFKQGVISVRSSLTLLASAPAYSYNA
jgi:hypothetical protein